MKSKNECRAHGGGAMSARPARSPGDPRHEHTLWAYPVSRRLSRGGAVALVGLFLLTGCASLSHKAASIDKQALQERLDERLAAADQALQQGQAGQALALLDAAARLDPAAKQPWLKMAQIHFEARQYGQAITEAQEVLQRDVRDLTAQSILAVSGLRVSAQALGQLRKVNEVNGSTRSEAESVARIIHEALGEPILLSASPSASAPGPQGGASTVTPRLTLPSGRARNAVRPKTAGAPGAAASASTASPAAAVSPSPPRAPSTAPAFPSPRNNPFGALQ